MKSKWSPISTSWRLLRLLRLGGTRGVGLGVATIIVIPLPIGRVGIGTVGALALLGVPWVPIVHRVTPLVNGRPRIGVIHHWGWSLGWRLG